MTGLLTGCTLDSSTRISLICTTQDLTSCRQPADSWLESTTTLSRGLTYSQRDLSSSSARYSHFLTLAIQASSSRPIPAPGSGYAELPSDGSSVCKPGAQPTWVHSATAPQLTLHRLPARLLQLLLVLWKRQWMAVNCGYACAASPSCFLHCELPESGRQRR